VNLVKFWRERSELEEVLCLKGWGGTACKITFEAVSSVSGYVADLLIRRRYGWRKNDGWVGFDVKVMSFDRGWLGTWTCTIGTGG